MTEEYFYYWKKQDILSIVGIILIVIFAIVVIMFVASISHNMKDEFCKQEKISEYIDYDTCYNNYALIQNEYNYKEKERIKKIVKEMVE